PESGRQRRDSFVGGMSAAPAVVRGATSWACVELRLTPRGAYRVLGWPMPELTNRAVPLEDVLPEADELTTRLRETPSWAERLDLLGGVLEGRVAGSEPPSA